MMENKSELIPIGKIVGASGLKGEVRIFSYSGNPQRLESLDAVYVGEIKRTIRSVRYVKAVAVVGFAGVESRESAEALRETELFIREADLAPLPEDTYYVRDLIGLNVYDAGGTSYGRIDNVIQNSAQDLYEITGTDGKAFLLPAVGAFVKSVDLAEGRMVVEIPAGLLDL